VLRTLVATLALAASPVTFTWPTSIDVQQDGTLLVVENGQHRVVRLDPETGAVTQVAAGFAKPIAVAHAGSATYLSNGHTIVRLGRGVVARTSADIGPIAVSPRGAIAYTTETSAWRLVNGKPHAIATNLSGPHGIAFARDGAVLVADTNHNRVIRIANGRTTTLIKVGQPRGIDVAADGSIYLVEAVAKKVGHYSATGKRLGSVGHGYTDPYDVQVAPDKTVYVVDTSVVGTIVRVAPDGTVSTVSA
jgi:streptogramin lyase